MTEGPQSAGWALTQRPQGAVEGHRSGHFKDGLGRNRGDLPLSLSPREVFPNEQCAKGFGMVQDEHG